MLFSTNAEIATYVCGLSQKPHYLSCDELPAKLQKHIFIVVVSS